MPRLPTPRLFTIVCLLSITAAATAGPPSVTIDAPTAGVDYPTDVPLPKPLVGTRVLVIDKSRIVIGKQSVLADPEPGTDYPTDAPIPARLKSSKIIVLDGKQRVAITLEPPKAGVDYPTDAPAPTSPVWVFGNSTRLPLASIVRLEHAVAGTDFPTDGPPKLDRNFYVAVAKDGKRTRVQ